ncbi:MAG: Stk1 family PASTA domain-containing Ser/Thr kinase [Blautia sp.]|jgi:serine/threonine protein kinase/beta-lactam-binding protein with PASTA domain
MLKAGMFIGERYEIVGKVGSGGMADVYKAKDHKLNRFVAVKVLKQEFREDVTFIRKFRTEAQSAAGLTHPNIVNVFDVGEDEGVNYIVMELIEGITLKEYISKKGCLSVKEATSIAIQVSMGLEAAHSHGIVHRDVKPQNIIISTDGKVKVTDFGIARAASSNTISSNAMGSVHYSSPEQVRGGYSDEKSDIYSLGITLYEMVTGRVPFDGETTVAIAIKHLQEELVPPSTYTPDLPYSLERIIEKCTQKSVDRRYNNMEEVIADLKHSLIDPQGDFVKLVPLSNHAQTVVLSDAEMDAIRKGNTQQQTVPAPASKVADLEPEDDTYDNSYDDDYDDYDSKKGLNKGLEKAMTIGAILVGILIIIALIVFIGNRSGFFATLFGGQSDKKTEESKEPGTTENKDSEDENLVEVPNLVGRTEQEAKEMLTDLGIGMTWTGDEVSDQPKGTISSQEIEPGTMVELYTTINYKRSSGNPTLTIPEVLGRTQADAQQMLEDMGFAVEVTKSYDNDYNYEIGQVMAVSPEEGSEASAGSTVTITVSLGIEGYSATVPDVVGMTEEEAKAALTNAALTYEVVSQMSDEVEAGKVISQDVEAYSEVDKETTVTITVSTGSSEPTPSVTQTPATTQTPSDTSGTWKCTQKLDTPDGYGGGVVRMELVQTVNGSPKATTIVDGKQVEFPYQLNLEGEPGITEGTLYLSELVGSDYVELGHYPLTFEKAE